MRRPLRRPTRRPMRRSTRCTPVLLALLASAAGCSAPPAATTAMPDAGPALPDVPITRFVGELHLHQFPAGAHAGAAFASEPVALSDVNGDELHVLWTTPT